MSATATHDMFKVFEVLWGKYPDFKQMLNYVQSIDNATPYKIQDKNGDEIIMTNHIKQLLIEAITPYSNFEYTDDNDGYLFFQNDQPEFEQEVFHKVQSTRLPKEVDTSSKQQQQQQQQHQHDDTKSDDQQQQQIPTTKTIPVSLSQSNPTCPHQHHQCRRIETAALPRYMPQDEFFKQIQFLDEVFCLSRSRFKAAQLAEGVVLEIAGGNGASSLAFMAYNPKVTTICITDATNDSIIDGIQRLDKLLTTDGYTGIKKEYNITTENGTKITIPCYNFSQTPPLLDEILHDINDNNNINNKEHNILKSLPMNMMQKSPQVPKNVDIYIFHAFVHNAGEIMKLLSQVATIKPIKYNVIDTVFELLGLCSSNSAINHINNIASIFNNHNDNNYNIVIMEHGLTDSTFFNSKAFRSTFLHYSFNIGCCPIRNLRALLQGNKSFQNVHIQPLSPPTIFIATATVHQQQQSTTNEVDITATQSNMNDNMMMTNRPPITPTFEMDAFLDKK